MLEDYLAERRVPVVLAPKNRALIVDRHHLVRACWEAGIEEVLVEKLELVPIAMGAGKIPVIASACAQRAPPIRHASSPVIATSAAPASEAKVRNRASDCKPNSNSEMRATKGMMGG